MHSKGTTTVLYYNDMHGGIIIGIIRQLLLIKYFKVQSRFKVYIKDVKVVYVLSLKILLNTQYQVRLRRSGINKQNVKFIKTTMML